MSLPDRALYLEALLEQWEHGSVAPTPEACAAELGFAIEAWRDAWPKLSACFVARKKDGRLVNPKLEGLRREQQRFIKAQRQHGRRGAIQRWEKEKTDKAAYGDPIGLPSDADGLLEGNGSGGNGSGGSGSKGSGERHHASAMPHAASAPTALLVFPTTGSGAKEWALTSTQLDEWATAYPALDVTAEARKALAWVKANAGHRKTAKGMPSFLVKWFNRAVDNGQTRRSPSSRPVAPGMVPGAVDKYAGRTRGLDRHDTDD